MIIFHVYIAYIISSKKYKRRLFAYENGDGILQLFSKYKLTNSFYVVKMYKINFHFIQRKRNML